MITTVTLNPMLDKTVYVDPIEKGKIQRSPKIEYVAGGKGINVSRQLRKLGCETLATGFLGGEIGMMLERLLSEEGVPHDFVHVSRMTREGVTYRHPDGSYTAVFEPPQVVSREETHRLVEHCARLLNQSVWIVCSGSSPSADADNAFAEIITLARAMHVPAALDSYGLAFNRAFAALPTLVKLNKEETEQAFGQCLESESDYRSALRRCLEKGIGHCIITNGSRALYAASVQNMWRVFPPSVPSVNPTGSGDSLLAGLLFGILQHWPFERCLAFGTAAGAANAQKWEVANSSRNDIDLLVGHVPMEKL